MFECVASSFAFNRCLRQGRVDAHHLWQKMATQLFANVEEEWVRKRNNILLDFEGERAHEICSFMWADNFWIMSYSQKNLEQMLRDLIEEASRWDMVPDLASLWWTSTVSPLKQRLNRPQGFQLFVLEQRSSQYNKEECQ